MSQIDELKALTGNADAKQIPVESVINSAQGVLAGNDEDRLQAGTSLVNTFNFAIQVQAGRVLWQVSDYKAFLIALCAMDAIGKTPTIAHDKTKE